MCAILGRIKTANSRNSGSIELGLKTLSRRGPDSHGVWRSDDGHVELLHTRLAIVDSDPRATQPMTDEANGLIVSFNGEIYNFRELRRELSAYSFKTESDTEVILAAYALRGVKGFSLLKGMFTLSLVDTRARRIWLARDAVGKKPLYLARWDGQVCFGSSLQAISEACRGTREISNEAAESYWNEGFIRPDLAVWKDAQPLLPGEIIELNWSGEELSRSRHAPQPLRLYEGEGLDEVQDAIDGLLEAAVNRRLQDNPNPAVLCSGGIDSTVVTMMAARIEKRGGLDKPLKILTLGAMVPLTNDERYARYAAWRLGKNIEVLRPQFRALSSSVLDCLDIQDEPLGMISFFPLWRLVQAVSDHSRILISGEGGDEFFLGYSAPKRWSQTENSGVPDADARCGSHVTCGPELPSWMSDWGRSMATDHLVGHSFAKVDRASAEQGVEMRCPLLDWDLICYVRSLPYSILAVEPVLKPLLKRQLSGWPSRFINRPKLGFTMNLRYLWGASNYQGLREAILVESQNQFADYLPSSLLKPASDWRALDIFRNFPAVWKLLAWSRFENRNIH
jgi:asparagine synthase (glutamine-hydrolysing)